MKNKYKILTVLSIGAVTAISTSVINKLISVSATSKELYPLSKLHTYDWRLGKIQYRKVGQGKPVLLLHDLTPASSSYEWNKITDHLRENHTVYTIDLLGCGASEKLDMTYTNYLYVQLISDFIRDIIGHRTDVVCSGSSSSIAIMACHNDAALFDQLILINPDSLKTCSQTPNKQSKLYKFILDTPILGTLIYNIAYSKKSIRDIFISKYISNPYGVRTEDINIYHEVAHQGKYYAKKIYASIKGKYTNISIASALSKIDNSIIIIGGKDIKGIHDVIKEYKELNSAIEYSLLEDSKQLPQLECPKKLFQALSIYLQ